MSQFATIAMLKDVPQKWEADRNWDVFESQFEIHATDADVFVTPEGYLDGYATTEEDWTAEYLDLILAVKVVDSLDEALEHIETYTSGHTEAIVTEDYSSASRFQDEVDASVVIVNASSRFNDGGQFGMGLGTDADDDPVGLFPIDHGLKVGVDSAPETEGVTPGFVLIQVTDPHQLCPRCANVRIDAPGRKVSGADDCHSGIGHRLEVPFQVGWHGTRRNGRDLRSSR